MAKITRTEKNPHGLSSKQRLVIYDAVNQVSNGTPLDLVKSTEKYYSAKNTVNARNISNQNLGRENFRGALIEELHNIGIEDKLEKKLKEGLEATKTTRYGEVPDYLTRLGYIRELHKILGLYAPNQKESRSFSITANLTSEELDRRIEQLQKELAT